MNRIIKEAAKESSIEIHENGVYVVIEGPQFSSKIESEIYRKWGCNVIGMTNMPEAKLAREAEICYSTIAMVTDYDCWHPSHDSVTVEMILQQMAKNVVKQKRLFLILPDNIEEVLQMGITAVVKMRLMLPS